MSRRPSPKAAATGIAKSGMHPESCHGRVHLRLILSLSIVLLTGILAWAVDYDADLLEDGWEAQYGFSADAFSATDLVGWWQMDDDSMGDIRDRSGNGLHGTMSNFPGSPFVSGSFNTAVSFDSDSVASFTVSSPLNLSTAFTVSAWFKGSSASGETTLVRWEGGNGCYWRLGVSAAGEGFLEFVDGSSNVTKVGEVIANGALDVRDGVWHHLAATYDTTGGVARMYVDGQEEDSGSLSGWSFSSASSFSMGAASNEDFLLDEVRLYDITIAAADIVKLPETFTDTDEDGLTNYEEQVAGTDPTLEDTDGDGVDDGADTYPLDYYNGALPTLSIIDGDGQKDAPESVLAFPLIVEVRDSSSNLLENAPVTFIVASGGGGVMETVMGSPGTSMLSVRTDSNGRAQVYLQLPDSYNTTVVVQVKAVSGVSNVSEEYTAYTDEIPQSGLKLWLQADNGVTKDGSNYLSAWADQSGNGNNAAQSNAGNRPLWVASGINGNPVVRFDGSNDYLLAGDGLGSSQSTIAVLYSKPSRGGGTTQRVYSSSSSGSNDSSNNGAFYDPETDYFDSGITDGPLVRTQTYATSKSLLNFRLGARNTSTSSSVGLPFYGDIAEMVVYNRVLSASEQAAVRRYFAQHYDLPIPGVAASQAGGVISGPVNVTLSTSADFPSALIRYTLDGSEPTEDGTNPSSLTYGSTISITATTTLKVKVFESGFVPSVTQAFVYTLESASSDVPRSGLKLWLRGDLGVMADGSNAVSEWIDQSGSGNKAVQLFSANYYPHLLASGINGHPALNFDIPSNSYDWMVVKNSMGNSPATVVVLYDMPAYGGSWSQFIYSSAPPGDFDYRLGGVYYQPETDYQYGGVTDGPLIRIQTYSSSMDLSNFRIGKRNNNNVNEQGNNYKGNIAEMLVYNRVLTSTEQKDIRRHLLQHYDLPIPGVAASPFSSLISGPVNVTLSASADFPSALIRYTLDGSEPTEDGTNPSSLTYSGSAIAVTGTTAVKVKVFEGGFEPSETQTFTYTLETASEDVPRSGLKLWLRADLGIIEDGSSFIRTWEDQSGGGNNAVQLSSGNRPVLGATSINGHPVVGFDGTNDQMIVGSGVSGSSPATVVVVYNKTLWGGGTSQRLYSSSSYANHDYNNGGIYQLPTTGYNTQGITAGAQINIQTSSSNKSLENFHIGAENLTPPYSSGNNYYGDIAEIIVYNRVLSASELQAVELYLYHRYNIIYGTVDSDGDGLTDLEEIIGGTDKDDPDSNNDGIFDGLSQQMGIDPLSADVDGDGISNADEIAQGTDPFLADSDQDGHDDDEDAYPLDPSRWQGLASDPGDVTGPVITLTQPKDASLVP